MPKKFWTQSKQNQNEKKRSERCKHCMHTGCSKMRTPRRPPAHPLHTHRQDQLEYTVQQLASMQCKNTDCLLHQGLDKLSYLSCEAYLSETPCTLIVPATHLVRLVPQLIERLSSTDVLLTDVSTHSI